MLSKLLWLASNADVAEWLPPNVGFSCRYAQTFQITNLMHNSFIFQQYICYTQSALHPLTVRLLTEGDDTRGYGDTIGPPEDEQCAARNMLRSVV